MDALRWAFAQDMPCGRKLVLLALADHVRDGEIEAWPSFTMLETKCSMARTTLSRHLAALAASGHLVKCGPTHQKSQTYRLAIGSETLPVVQNATSSETLPASVAKRYQTGSELLPQLVAKRYPNPNRTRKRTRRNDISLSPEIIERFQRCQWVRYPAHRLGDKASALKAYAALSDAERDLADAHLLAAVACEDWQREGGKWAPSINKWFGEERWRHTFGAAPRAAVRTLASYDPIWTKLGYPDQTAYENATDADVAQRSRERGIA